jgi:hypothetical protein
MAISATTAALIGAGVAAVGVGSSIMSSVAQQQQQQQQMEAQAAYARQQEKVTQLQGQLAQDQAEQQAAANQEQATAMRSKQVAQAIALGVDPSSGSLLSIVDATQSQAARERKQILQNGALSKAASDTSAASYAWQANNSNSSSGWGTVGTVASGLGSAVSGANTVLQLGQKAGWFDGPTTTADPWAANMSNGVNYNWDMNNG